IFSRTTHT
ncbi:putative endonuclease 4 domain protein, partial [Vibrio parahaemolyticus V-223/04]